MTEDLSDTGRFVIINNAGAVVRASAELSRLLGYAETELTGQPAKLILGRRTPDLPDLDSLEKALGGEGSVGLLAQDGREVPVRVTMKRTPAPYGNEVWLVLTAESVVVPRAAAAKPATPPPPPKPPPPPPAIPPTSSPPPAAVPPPVRTPPPGSAPGAFLTPTFLVNMSHEFRTPLNGIAGTVAMLAESPLSPRQREWVNLLRQSTASLVQVMTNVLDFARMEGDDLTLRWTDFSLNGVLDEVLRPAAEAARFKGLAFQVTRPDGDLVLRGDPERVRQVFAQLVDNAVKFTAQGEVTILVQKENETDRDLRVRFVVKDTGPGVPRAERAKLFNAFSQLDGSSTRAHDGLGLGLAVAQRLTTLMKGTLDVEGEEGQGGVFVAVLPLDKSDRPLAPVPAPTTGGQPAAPALPRRHYRILIVEDNAVNQKVALLLLEKLGYTAELADNGQQAVAAFENGIFDLILMDCQMPVLDGYQATIEMRKREGQKRHVPILAVTANSSDEDREKCFASGMDEYVTKPLSVDRLSSLLAKWDVSVEPEALNGLKELGVETFPQIRDQFLTQSLEQMDQLGTAVAAGDWKAVHALCHKIKGSSGTFGAVRMQRLCRRGEEAATRENGKDLAFLAEALREEFERVRLFLQ